VAVLAFFFLVLTIGGLSSFQAWSILSGTQKIQEQGHHIQLTEAIHVTIHLLKECLALIQYVLWYFDAVSPAVDDHVQLHEFPRCDKSEKVTTGWC